MPFPPRWLREHPAASVLGVLVLGGITLHSCGLLRRAQPEVHERVRDEKVVSSTVTKRQTLQGEVEELKTTLQQQENTLKDVTKTLQAVAGKFEDSEQQRKREQQAYAQELKQERERNARERQRLAQERREDSRQATTVAKEPKERMTGATASPPPPPIFELQTLGKSNNKSRRAFPAGLQAQEGAYLPATSFAAARILTGIEATEQGAGNPPGAEGDEPVMVVLTGPFHPPPQLQGPQRNGTPTEIPMHGCRLFGWARAKLGSGRVLIHLYLMACVFPDQSTVEMKIRGYVTDKDGTNGVVGRVETRDSAMIARALAVGVIKEASALIGLAKSSIVVTSNAGGFTQPFTGVQSSIDDISRYYLDQARRLGPVVWVESQVPVNVVMQEGVPLEGYPLTVALGDK